MELNSIKDAFDRVTKKQKLSSSKIQEVIDQISQENEKALDNIQSASSSVSVIDHRSVLSELHTSLHNAAPLTQLEGPQKELNVALTKYVKILEKSCNPDISKAYRNFDFDIHTLNQIIASHFYHQGLFDIGDQFIRDARESEAAAVMKSPFQQMFQILEAIRNHDLRPALNWANTVADKLSQHGSTLLLKLHAMEFLETVRSGNTGEALDYARAKLAPFASTHMDDVQKAMVCILWSGKLDRCPYHVLVSPNWNWLVEDFKKEFCNLLDQSYKSSLSTTVEAGVQALPPLLKFLSVMAGKRQEWQTVTELPIPVELDSKFHFHSIFICPVSKEPSTEDNPPMLMSCGHVLCKQSIAKMSKNSTKSFKCPYCPYDIDAAQCMQLYF
ncbi:hypothetical protein QN277_028499 [Acacia crassicarpa]|uniref:Uncharacterized protein n=1 Tax=Acacia crassicarpa TaxID=499986 RepID=A0AAE1MID3_9FABA|nr:hypothetical protein QN277_028499 [Acacia crassicarpa]